MGSALVTFMGGPVDGRSYAITADYTGQPPDIFQVNAYVWEDPDGEPTVYVARYRRTVNPADDGPLWVYLYEPPDDGPVLPESTIDALDPAQIDPGTGR